MPHVFGFCGSWLITQLSCLGPVTIRYAHRPIQGTNMTGDPQRRQVPVSRASYTDAVRCLTINQSAAKPWPDVAASRDDVMVPG